MMVSLVNIFCIVLTLALTLSFPINAQEICFPLVIEHKFNNEALKGEVKSIHYYGATSSNLAYLKSDTFKMYLVKIDSFSVNGKLLLTNYYSGNDLANRYDFKYDTTGKLTEIVWHDIKTNAEAHSLLKYDDRSNIKSQNLYNTLGELCRLIKYTFDDKILLMDSDSFVSSNRSTITSYRYDANGRITQAICNEPHGVTEYRYDTLKNIISICSFNSASSLTTVFKYDDYQNSILQEVYIDTSFIDRTYTHYIYDSMGNWKQKIQEISSEWPLNYSLTKRQINYYKL